MGAHSEIAWQKTGLKQPKFKPEPTYKTNWDDIDGTRTLVGDREVKGGERQIASRLLGRRFA